MRDPLGMQEIETKEEKSSILKIENIPEFDLEDYDLMDTKDFAKYISNIESIVRTSFEYRTLIAYLKENMDMHKCSFYENIDSNDYRNIRIEVHHDPFSLYDISIIVYNKRISNRESIEVELVAKEIMYLHYSLLIGLIPLSETVHELVHNQYLFIPSDKVFGKYKEFYNLYSDYMTGEMIDTYERIQEFNKSYDDTKQNLILEKSYIYLDLEESYSLPTYKQVLDTMSNKIKELKSNSDISLDFQPKKKKIISFLE